MRALDPDGLLLDVGPAVDNHLARPDQFLRHIVEFLNPDGAMALVKRLSGGRTVIDDVCFAVAVEEKRGIDAVETKPDRIGPRPGRICRRNEKITAAIHAGIDDGENAIVIFDCGREDTARNSQPIEVQLCGPVDGVSDLRPMHQIAAVEHRNAGKIRKRRVDEVVILADAHDAWVRIETGKDWVQILLRRGFDGLVDRVMTVIVEPIEARDFRRRRGLRGRLPAGLQAARRRSFASARRQQSGERSQQGELLHPWTPVYFSPRCSSIGPICGSRPAKARYIWP